MADRQPLSIVIRIPNVRLSQSALATALGTPLHRYDEETASRPAYAQIDIPKAGDQWKAACKVIESISDAYDRLLSNKSVGVARLDIATTLPSSALSTSLTIPSLLAAAVGATGMEIDISIYRTESKGS